MEVEQFQVSYSNNLLTVKMKTKVEEPVLKGFKTGSGKLCNVAKQDVADSEALFGGLISHLRAIASAPNGTAIARALSKEQEGWGEEGFESKEMCKMELCNGKEVEQASKMTDSKCESKCMLGAGDGVKVKWGEGEEQDKEV